MTDEINIFFPVRLVTFVFILTGVFGSQYLSPYSVMESCGIITIGSVSADLLTICPSSSHVSTVNASYSDCIAHGKAVGKRHFQNAFQIAPRASTLLTSVISSIALSGLTDLTILTESEPYSLSLAQGVAAITNSFKIPLTIINLGAAATQTIASATEVCNQLATQNPAGLLISSNQNSTCFLIMNLCESEFNWSPQATVIASCAYSTTNFANTVPIDYVYSYTTYDPVINDNDHTDTVNYIPINNQTSAELWADSFQKRMGYIPGKNEEYGGGIAETLVFGLLSTPSLELKDLRTTIQLLYQPTWFGLIAFDSFGSVVSDNIFGIQYTQQPPTSTSTNSNNNYNYYYNSNSNSKSSVGPYFNIITPEIDAQARIIFPAPYYYERVYISATQLTKLDLFIVILTSLMLIYEIVVSILVIRNKETPQIRAITPSFCLLTILGGILMLISNYFWLQYNQTNITCRSHVWFVSLGFTLMFTPIFLKTYRLWRIFESKKLVTNPVTIRQLYIAVTIPTLLDIIYLAIWTGTTDMSAILTVIDPLRPANDIPGCNLNLIWTWINAGIKIFGLLLGCILIWFSRKLPPRFNESKAIGSVMYMILLAALIVLPILASGGTSTDLQFVVRSLGIILIVFTTTTVLILIKLPYLEFEDSSSSAMNGPVKGKYMNYNNGNKVANANTIIGIDRLDKPQEPGLTNNSNGSTA